MTFGTYGKLNAVIDRNISPAIYYVETNFIGQLHDEYSRFIKKVVDLFLFHEFSYDKNVIIKITQLDCCQIIILSIYVLSTHA
jgi:hypothetical protein